MGIFYELQIQKIKIKIKNEGRGLEFEGDEIVGILWLIDISTKEKQEEVSWQPNIAPTSIINK